MNSTSPVKNNGTQHRQAYSLKTTQFPFLFFFFSIFLIPPSFAQDCSDSDACMDFTFESKVDNADGTSSYCFSITNNCNKALSNVAFSVPQEASSPADNSTYQSVNGNNYHIENTTNNPFLSIKFETIGEGVKNGAGDMFCFDLPTSLDYNSITIEGKAANKKYRVTIDLSDCLDNSSSCSDLPDLNGGSIMIISFETGKLTDATTTQAGVPLEIYNESPPQGGSDEFDIVWIKCTSGTCNKSVDQLEGINIIQFYDAYVANPNASGIGDTCWEFIDDEDSDDLSLTLNDGVAVTTCFIRYVRSAGCEDFTLSSLVQVTIAGGTPYNDSEEGFASKVNFTTYPNPARDQVTILVDSKFAGQKGNLIVCNQFGKTIIQKDIEVENNTPIKLNTSALSVGIYNVYINFDKGENSIVNKLLIHR